MGLLVLGRGLLSVDLLSLILTLTLTLTLSPTSNPNPKILTRLELWKAALGGRAMFVFIR